MTRYIKVTQGFAEWLVDMAVALFNNGVRGHLDPRAPLPGGDHQADNPLERIPDDAFPDPDGKKEFIGNFVSFCRYIAVVLFHKLRHEMHDDRIEDGMISDDLSTTPLDPRRFGGGQL
jgi:hypothetical protein